MELNEAAKKMPIRQPGGFGRRRELPVITIERNGKRRQYRVSPFSLAAMVCVVVLLGVSYISAAAYLAFRDDLIGFSDSSNARLIRNYEKRIADLRGNLDRVTSQQMVEQKILEDRIEGLLRRQTLVESRASKLGALIDKSHEAGLIDEPDESADAGTTDGVFTAAIRGGNDASAVNKLPTIAAVAELPDLTDIAQTHAVLDTLERRIRIAAEDQTDAITIVRAKVGAELDAAYEVVRRLDLTGVQIPQSVGGPYVPPSRDEGFDSTAATLEDYLLRIAEVRDTLEHVPLAEPIPGKKATSAFGNRIDPFLGRMAMHTGIDFGANTGTPVQSTAPGTVVEAGRNGGYGNTVLIRHEGGFETRYAHLSRFSVQAGEAVQRGTTIGKVGSTGRSTGPHLHYEVHRDEIPENPAKYLKAGRELRRIIDHGT